MEKVNEFECKKELADENTDFRLLIAEFNAVAEKQLAVGRKVLSKRLIRESDELRAS